MKSRVIVFAFAFVFSGFVANAQEYKVAKSSGRLELNIGRVTVEGHSGNEIIFTSANPKSSKDQRAEGLRLVNSLGLEDNGRVSTLGVASGSGAARLDDRVNRVEPAG